MSDAATTIGTGSVFEGIVVSNAAITGGAGSAINGRALSAPAAVRLDANTIDSNSRAGQTPAATK